MLILLSSDATAEICFLLYLTKFLPEKYVKSNECNDTKNIHLKVGFAKLTENIPEQENVFTIQELQIKAVNNS